MTLSSLKDFGILGKSKVCCASTTYKIGNIKKEGDAIKEKMECYNITRLIVKNIERR